MDVVNRMHWHYWHIERHCTLVHDRTTISPLSVRKCSKIGLCVSCEASLRRSCQRLQSACLPTDLWSTEVYTMSWRCAQLVMPLNIVCILLDPVHTAETGVGVRCINRSDIMGRPIRRCPFQLYWSPHSLSLCISSSCNIHNLALVIHLSVPKM